MNADSSHTQHSYAPKYMRRQKLQPAFSCTDTIGPTSVLLKTTLRPSNDQDQSKTRAFSHLKEPQKLRIAPLYSPGSVFFGFTLHFLKRPQKTSPDSLFTVVMTTEDMSPVRFLTMFVASVLSCITNLTEKINEHIFDESLQTFCWLNTITTNSRNFNWYYTYYKSSAAGMKKTNKQDNIK